MKITDENTDELNLKGKISSKNLEEVLSSLRKNNNLKSLDISDNKLGDRNVRTLLEVLSKLTSLELLNLSNNILSPVSLIHLSKFIAESKSLKRLYLANNRLGERYSNHYYFYQFAKSLNQSTTLIELDLSKNQFTSKTFQPIAKELECNSSILYLNLSQNKFDAFSAKLIAEILKRNQKLTHLGLAGNHEPNSKGSTFYKNPPRIHLVPIFEAINENNSLEKLDLSENELNFNEKQFLASYHKSKPKLIVDLKDKTENHLSESKIVAGSNQLEISSLNTLATTLLNSNESRKIIQENPDICKNLGMLGSVLEERIANQDLLLSHTKLK